MCRLTKWHNKVNKLSLKWHFVQKYFYAFDPINERRRFSNVALSTELGDAGICSVAVKIGEALSGVNIDCIPVALDLGSPMPSISFIGINSY